MKRSPWVAVLLILLAVAAIRVRLLHIPLERDEGEYAYAGQLMLQAIPPYQLAANMKLPGTYAAYGLIMALLGQSIAAIHIGLLLVNAAAIVFVFLIGRRLFNATAGVAACAAYATMSTGESIMGTQAHATHFVMLAALGGTWLLLRYADSTRLSTLCWSGVLFGLSVLMKQHAVFFVLFGVLYVAKRDWRKLGWFLPAAALPYAVTCLVLWYAGVFSRFWFWTFTYARQYAAENTLADGLDFFIATFPPIVLANPAIWMLAAAGLFVVWRAKPQRSTALFVTAFLCFSFLAVCPGLYFREHYFVMMLPAIAILAGAATRTRGAWTVMAAAVLLSLFLQREFLFRMSPMQASRDMYGDNPFPEAIQVSDYIRTHSGAGARIAVLGSEPEIYFYSHRHSATSHIYMYGLMEQQPYALTMQNELIREVETATPEYVVYADIDASWLRDNNSPTRLFDWWSTYQPAHYQPVNTTGALTVFQRVR